MIIIELIGGILAVIGVVISVLMLAYILPIVLFFLQAAVYKAINNVYHWVLSLKYIIFKVKLLKLIYFTTPHISISFDNELPFDDWELGIDIACFFWMFNVYVSKE